MIPVSLERVAEDCSGVLGKKGSYGTEQVFGVVMDNRLLSPGDLFVAIRGERVDGNSFAKKALESGAVAVLTADPQAAEKNGADPERIIAVSDVQRALGDLARANLVRVRKHGKAMVVAVTGSVGKTTTKDLLASILAQRGPIIAPPGSFNNELGLPLTVLRADETTTTLVLEMGADHIGNIDYLTSIAPPDISIVLAVARAHLGEFGGIENVQKAKTELVKGTLLGGTVVLNADDSRVASMAAFAQGPVVYFSTQGKGEVSARDITIDKTGHPCFTLVAPEGERYLSLGLVGIHHVSNALAAAAAAHALGCSLESIVAALEGKGPASPHRMDVFPSGSLRIIDDSYNANPDSMRAGLQAASHIADGARIIAVLGEMMELGEESAAEHAALGEVVHECGVHTLISVGVGTIPTAEKASERGVEVYRVQEVENALALLSSLAAPGDVVLLKGSHGSRVWSIADRLKEGQTVC